MSGAVLTVRQLREALARCNDPDAQVWLTWADDEMPALGVTIEDGRVLRICADLSEMGSRERVLCAADESGLCDHCGERLATRDLYDGTYAELAPQACRDRVCAQCFDAAADRAAEERS